MTTAPLAPGERCRLLLAHEERMARRLAGMVLDKPRPPIWMIFIPVFFVFYAYRLQEYKKGLKRFAEHILVSRRRALLAAEEAVAQKTEPDIDALVARADTVPDSAGPLYREWISLLTDHYRNLLSTGADSVAAMTRGHYRNKTSYLLFVRQLDKAEDAFNTALLPHIEGDSEDIRYVARRLRESVLELHRQEVETLFS